MGWGMHRGSKPATRSVGVAVDVHPRPLDRNVLKVVMRVQWYVIQVMKGREDSMASLIGRVVPKSLLQEVFSPKYETEIKVRGRWVPVQKTLLPGYLIAVTNDPEGLEAVLRDLPEFARLLAQGNEFVPLAPAEVEIIGSFTSPGKRVVPMSIGVKDGDRVVIIEDVTTSGKSIEETFPIIKAQGDVTILGLMVSLNRMEKGKGEKSALDEIHDKYGLGAKAIVTMAEVIEYLYNKEYNGKIIIDDTLKAAIDAYYEIYGVK